MDLNKLANIHKDCVVASLARNQPIARLSAYAHLLLVYCQNYQPRGDENNSYNFFHYHFFG